jgi:hypothetical protein
MSSPRAALLCNREEARALLSYIDTSTLTGLRDRALIAIMIYTFAPSARCCR